MKTKRYYEHYSTCYNCGRRYGHDGDGEVTTNKCPICTKGRSGIIGALKTLAKRIPKDPKKIKVEYYYKPKKKEIKVQCEIEPYDDDVVGYVDKLSEKIKREKR